MGCVLSPVSCVEVEKNSRKPPEWTYQSQTWLFGERFCTQAGGGEKHQVDGRSLAEDERVLGGKNYPLF